MLQLVLCSFVNQAIQLHERESERERARENERERKRERQRERKRISEGILVSLSSLHVHCGLTEGIHL